MNDLKNRGAQDILIAVVARHAAHLLGRLDERFVNAGQGLSRRTRPENLEDGRAGAPLACIRETCTATPKLKRGRRRRT